MKLSGTTVNILQSFQSFQCKSDDEDNDENLSKHQTRSVTEKPNVCEHITLSDSDVETPGKPLAAPSSVSQQSLSCENAAVGEAESSKDLKQDPGQSDPQLFQTMLLDGRLVRIKEMHHCGGSLV